MTKNGVRGLAVGLCVLALAAVLQVQPSSAQDTAGAGPPAAAPKGMYYVDFRARTAASYGHAFVWYGRTGQRKIEVAGLHPATESVVPYIVGHVIPVPSETGKSYGDLDEQYLEASYRVYMDEAQARRVFAYIKHLQSSRPLWNAAVYNCVSFIQDIARHMGLRVPNNHMLYPKNWVNDLRALNGGGKVGRMPVTAEAEGFFGAPAPARAERVPAPARAARAPAPGRAASAPAPARAAAIQPRDRMSAPY